MVYSFTEARSASSKLNGKSPVQHIGTLHHDHLALELFGRTLPDGRISIRVMPRRSIPGSEGKATSTRFFEPDDLFALSTLLIEASGLIGSWKRPVDSSATEVCIGPHVFRGPTLP